MRRPKFEVEFLRAASRTTSGEAYVNRVLNRLNKGAAEYDDSWSKRPVSELLEELGEEGDDLGGWSVLAAQVLQNRNGLSSDATTQLLQITYRIAQLGAEVDGLVALALSILDDG
jgi:hypothetical protein